MPELENQTLHVSAIFNFFTMGNLIDKLPMEIERTRLIPTAARPILVDLSHPSYQLDYQLDYQPDI